MKKTITLQDESYQKIKEYCKMRGIKISWLTENVILHYIELNKDKK